MSLSYLFLLLAVVFFGLKLFKVREKTFSYTDAGLFFWALSQLVLGAIYVHDHYISVVSN